LSDWSAAVDGEMGNPTAPAISVCIPTFRRPIELARLLDAVLGVVTRPAPIEIIVCDNDTRRSAQPVVEAIAGATEIPVRYFNEPIQNISLARNCLVAAARGEWIAFIDDDEVPGEDWLQALWTIAAHPGTDGAKGPVRRRLPAGAPDWLLTLPYGGSSLPAAGTPLPPRRMSGGNMMVRRSCLLRLKVEDGPFDAAFGLRGGEDILAYGQLALEGAVIRAAPDAFVEEYWGPERCHIGWMLRRAYRSGQVWSDVEARLHGRSSLWLRVPAAALRCLATALALPFSPALSPVRRAALLIRVAGLLGQASVVFDARMESYRVSKGGASAPLDGKAMPRQVA